MWSIISNSEAKPKNINPAGIKKWFLKFLYLLIDLIPINIGIKIACKCAKNNTKKNNLN